jgi:hypothetical protein
VSPSRELGHAALSVVAGRATARFAAERYWQAPRSLATGVGMIGIGHWNPSEKKPGAHPAPAYSLNKTKAWKDASNQRSCRYLLHVPDAEMRVRRA